MGQDTDWNEIRLGPAAMDSMTIFVQYSQWYGPDIATGRWVMELSIIFVDLPIFSKKQITQASGSNCRNHSCYVRTNLIIWFCKTLQIRWPQYTLCRPETVPKNTSSEGGNSYRKDFTIVVTIEEDSRLVARPNTK